LKKNPNSSFDVGMREEPQTTLRIQRSDSEHSFKSNVSKGSKWAAIRQQEDDRKKQIARQQKEREQRLKRLFNYDSDE
jgi:hypothetical protein